MIVICIDNDGLLNALTINKQYHIIEDNYTYYHTICDTGDRHSFRKERFITLEEYREKQLNEIFLQ